MHGAGGRHPVECLFDRLSDIEYPKGVVPVPEMVSGTAFFPGGAGLWREPPADTLPPMPFGKVMVLGHNFGKEGDYLRARRVGHERNTDTWRGLLRLLDNVGIRPEHCFFTNVYMGLKLGKSNLGRFPSTEAFQRGCKSFLEEQIGELKPRLILALGRFVPGPLAALSADLVTWAQCPENKEGAREFRDLDAAVPVKHGVHFRELATTVVVLLHPSKRELNLRTNPQLRRYKGLTGDHAERRMLEEATEVVRRHMPQTVTGAPLDAAGASRRNSFSSHVRSGARSKTIRWPASAPQRSM